MPLLILDLGIKTSASDGSLTGQSILDLGCGRGGGVAFLSKYYQPKETIGIDLSWHQIKFAQQ